MKRCLLKSMIAMQGFYLFPSCDAWNTSSPIKLFEYLACGRPVIVTNIPAHRDVLNGKPYAFFSADASPVALADTIRKAHAAREQFAELGAMARNQVEQHHTWAQQASRLNTFLDKVIAAQ